MEIAERSQALSMLESLFEQCLLNESQVVVIDGALGIGKTALLHAFVERSTKEGALFLSAAGSRAEHHITLGVIDQLLHGVRFPTPAVERVAELMAGGAGLMAGGVGGVAHVEHGRSDGVAVPVLRGMCDAVRELSEVQPVIIGIDDAHFMDTASSQCVLHLLRRLKSARLLVVFVVSAHSPAVRRVFDAEILRLPNSHRIVLSALSERGVAELLAQRLDDEAAVTLAAGCHEVSGGNPLLVSALIDDLPSSSGRRPPELVAGEAFGRAVLSCLYRGEPTLLTVARAIAVLGDVVSLPLLARLLEMPPEAVEQAIDELTAAGLLQATRFCLRHARAAVLDGMPPAERRAMHRRAAQLLNESGAPAAAIAQHLLATGHAEPWAGAVLREAAAQMLTEGRVDKAVSYLQLAHRASADDRERALAVSALNSAVWLINPRATRRHLSELAAAVRAGNLTGRDGALAFGHLLWHGYTVEAFDLLAVLSQDGKASRQLDGGGGLDSLRLWLPYACPGLADRFSTERAPAVAAKYPLTSAWAPHDRAAAALHAMLSGPVDGDVVVEAEQVLRGTSQRDGAIAPILAALAVLFYADRLDKAISWCDSLPASVGADQGLVPRALLGMVRSAIRHRQGDLAEAEARGQEALALLSPAGWGVAVAAPLAFLVLTATTMGKYEEASAYLKIPVPAAAFETLCGPHYLSARGHFYLATGAFDAALHDFEACGELVTRWGFDVPGFVPWRTDVAEAYLCRDAVGCATALVTEQLAMLRPGRSRTRGITLRAQATTSELHRRVPLLRDAAENFQFCGDRLSLAYTLADISRTYRALGEQRVADATARRASQLAERCGALPLKRSLAAVVAGPDGDAGRAGEPDERPPLAMLSDAERKVAVLAADGHTNRQISGKLHITVSTVEQHLTRVYRKLAVNRRSELPSRLQPEFAASGGGPGSVHAVHGDTYR